MEENKKQDVVELNDELLEKADGGASFNCVSKCKYRDNIADCPDYQRGNVICRYK